MHQQIIIKFNNDKNDIKLYKMLNTLCQMGTEFGPLMGCQRLANQLASLGPVLRPKCGEISSFKSSIRHDVHLENDGPF